MEPKNPEHVTSRSERMTDLDDRLAELRARLEHVGVPSSSGSRGSRPAPAPRQRPAEAPAHRPVEDLRDEEERLALLVFHSLDGDQARLLHFVHALGHLQGQRVSEPPVDRESDAEPSARREPPDERDDPHA
jgi:hypothetical protein